MKLATTLTTHSSSRAPITGVTAPLLSYGGSSVLATFLALGLLHSIHAQSRETVERKGRASIF